MYSSSYSVSRWSWSKYLLYLSGRILLNCVWTLNMAAQNWIQLIFECCRVKVFFFTSSWPSPFESNFGKHSFAAPRNIRIQFSRHSLSKRQSPVRDYWRFSIWRSYRIDNRTVRRKQYFTAVRRQISNSKFGFQTRASPLKCRYDLHRPQQ